MRILFLGDSITEGIPGVPYVPKIKKRFTESILINRGLGGDTVSSIFSRVVKMDDLDSFDQIVLFVGVNDIFGRMTKTYKILKILRKQRWAKCSSDFKEKYNSLVKHIQNKNSNIILISPLLIGEDINNKWNLDLYELRKAISDISNQNNLPYLDVYSSFVKHLSGKIINDYLPLKLSVIYSDLKSLIDSALVDQKSTERGLHLTLDGVHLNTVGADILSEAIIDYFGKI